MSVCSLHHISSLVLNKHFSGEERRGLLRLLYTQHIKYKIKGDSPDGRTDRQIDRQTDAHAVATSVLQSEQASGILHAIHLKKIQSTSIKTEYAFLSLRTLK